MRLLPVLALLVLLGPGSPVCGQNANPAAGAVLTGERQQWHRVSLTFVGPETAETADPNPFFHYRLNVTFTHLVSGEQRVVPGFFAADGQAGETSAQAGDRWRVHFAPPQSGEWRYTVSFRAGPQVAVSDDPLAGTAWAPLDGQTGRFSIAASDKAPPDFRARGALEYVGHRYLRFAGDGTYFLKGGVGSPETLLSYPGFDDTYRDVDTTRHPPAANPLISLPALQGGVLRFEPHVRDWREGDPVWKGERGKGLIGGINYLSSQGVNALYFLTMNVNGDGRNVWPWTGPAVRDRFDCSKLDQWEVVFSHLTRRGIMLHIVTQETENDHLLDQGNLGLYRKLYYRELVARFAHHPAITWNLGEENVQSVAQQLECMTWLRRLNPYRQHTVVHNDHWHAKNLHETFDPLLGSPAFTGTAIQDFYWNDVHSHVLHYVRASESAGIPWVVSADELGGANFGTATDADDPDHDDPRRFGVWATLMAGGAGVEWYFGWQNNSPDSDLSSENWRTRERMYRQTRLALDFFHAHLPFDRMQPMDEAIVGAGVFGLAVPGESYALFLPNGGGTRFQLGEHPGRYEVKWFNPREGGELQEGSIKELRGPGLNWTGWPPANFSRDWVALIRRVPETAPRMVFPGSEWQEAAPLDLGVDPVGLHHALNNWRMLSGPDGTDRVVVARRGVVIFRGKDAHLPGDIRSATKSVTSTVLGLLLADGRLDLQRPAAIWEPSLSQHYAGVTLRDFATMTSGYQAPGGSRWGEPSDDWSEDPYTPGPPLFAPGASYAYWDEAQMMLGRVLTQAAQGDLLELARQRLFAPLGMSAVEWGAEGIVGSWPIRNGCTGLALSTLDFARFGHLFLNRGRWQEQQVVPADWVEAATAVQVPAWLPVAPTDRAATDGRGVYGYNWWVNGVGANGRRLLPDAPAGAYYAAGRNHNVCVVVPEWEMVIVRVGSNDDGNPVGGHAATLNAFLRRLGLAVSPLDQPEARRR
jgi:CubicO group peptidase (beta-lactamase class C family)